MKNTPEARKRREYTRRWRAAHPLDAAGKKKRLDYTRAWLKAHPEKIEMYRATRAAKRSR